MSGHSKWAKIKRQKGANDLKRGMIFTKLARNITLAAREGGGDPDMNFALRIAIDKAKAVNMPSDNIERSIKKGIGGDDKTQFQKISYEAVKGNGAAFIIDCQTDNTNRTVSELKKILEMGGAKLASVGSVSWQFEELGSILLRPARLQKAQKFGGEDEYIPVSIEEIEMELLEIDGIVDIEEAMHQDEDSEFKVLEISTLKNNFAAVLKQVEKMQYKIVAYELVRIAKDQVALSGTELEKIETLVSNLEDHDDVDSVWSNVKEI